MHPRGGWGARTVASRGAAAASFCALHVCICRGYVTARPAPAKDVCAHAPGCGCQYRICSAVSSVSVCCLVVCRHGFSAALFVCSGLLPAVKQIQGDGEGNWVWGVLDRSRRPACSVPMLAEIVFRVLCRPARGDSMHVVAFEMSQRPFRGVLCPSVLGTAAGKAMLLHAQHCHRSIEFHFFPCGRIYGRRGILRTMPGRAALSTYRASSTPFTYVLYSSIENSDTCAPTCPARGAPVLDPGPLASVI